LALATLPTGQWFGLDRLVYVGWRRLAGGRRAVVTTAPVAVTTKKQPVVTAGR
jgi:hypothetical protein